MLDSEESWPASKEKPARYLGIAQNIGDLLTFYVYDESTRYVLARSVIRSDKDNTNKHVKWDPELTSGHKKTASIGGDILPKIPPQSPDFNLLESNADSSNLVSHPDAAPVATDSGETYDTGEHMDSGELANFEESEEPFLELDSEPIPLVDQSKMIGIQNPEGDGVLALSSTPLEMDPSIPELKRRTRPKVTKHSWKRQAGKKQRSACPRRQKPMPVLPKRKPKLVSLLYL